MIRQNYSSTENGGFDSPHWFEFDEIFFLGLIVFILVNPE